MARWEHTLPSELYNVLNEVCKALSLIEKYASINMLYIYAIINQQKTFKMKKTLLATALLVAFGTVTFAQNAPASDTKTAPAKTTAKSGSTKSASAKSNASKTTKPTSAPKSTTGDSKNTK